MRWSAFHSLLCATAAALAVAPVAQAQEDRLITLFAGSSVYADFYAGGDGGPAVNAGLANPDGLTADRAGNVYIVDCERIRKVDRAGIITTVAGTGERDAGGDGGPAVSAGFQTSCGTPPTSGIAADARGNLYFADAYNARIRKIDPTGIITTLADTAAAPGPPGRGSRPAGVAVDGAGNVYYVDGDRGAVLRIDTSGTVTIVAGGTGDFGCGYCPNGDGGPATAALLGVPTGLAVDRHGNLYITDRIHDRVRKVGPDGIISTLAGRAHEGHSPDGFSGDGGPAVNAELNGPEAIAVDGDGNVYVSDNNRIRRIDTAGIINTFAGGDVRTYSDRVPPTRTVIGWVSGLAFDAEGALYLSVPNAHHVRRIGPAATGALPLPSAKRCTSRRAFPIRVRLLPGIRFTSATVTVNGRRVPVYVYAERRRRMTRIGARYLNVRRFRAFVDLRGLVKGTYAVKITATTTDGRTLRSTRRYRTCAGGLKGGLPPL